MVCFKAVFQISIDACPQRPIDNIQALVQIMALRRSGDKPLSEPMMERLLTHICVLENFNVDVLQIILCNGFDIHIFLGNMSIHLGWTIFYKKYLTVSWKTMVDERVDVRIQVTTNQSLIIIILSNL